MAKRPGRLLDKTFTSFTEASGRLEDTINWVTAAEGVSLTKWSPALQGEWLHLLNKVLEKAHKELEEASLQLAQEVFGE